MESASLLDAFDEAARTEEPLPALAPLVAEGAEGGGGDGDGGGPPGGVAAKEEVLAALDREVSTRAELRSVEGLLEKGGSRKKRTKLKARAVLLRQRLADAIQASMQVNAPSFADVVHGGGGGAAAGVAAGSVALGDEEHEQLITALLARRAAQPAGGARRERTHERLLLAERLRRRLEGLPGWRPRRSRRRRRGRRRDSGGGVCAHVDAFGGGLEAEGDRQCRGRRCGTWSRRRGRAS